MTDNERLYTAKLYMDKLANGMNPFDGEELPEDTVLNNICLCRCFVFVSDILEQVINNGGEVLKRRQGRKEKFSITQSQREQIVLTESPVGVSTISSRISKVLDYNVKGIPAVVITMWLESQGLLTRVLEDGVAHKEATSQGNALGIETKEMKYGTKEYKKTLYDINAQAYIVANLDEISKFGG